MPSNLAAGAARPQLFPRAPLAWLLAFAVLPGVAWLIMLPACSGNHASTPPPLVTPQVIVGAVIPCPSGFFSDSATPAVCHSANLAGCPNAANLNFIYGYDNPGSPKGTIVLLGGSGGVDVSSEADSAGSYFGDGYEVVQIQWTYDWEATTVPVQYTGGTGTTTYPASIEVAACRPSTFLNFVFTTNNANLYSGGGRCAQGVSAGSAAIAYSLAYYAAKNYLDAVEMESGPPLADVEQGCEVPNAPPITICGDNDGAQFGCMLGGTSPWQLSPVYTEQAPDVRKWTNDSSCANGQTTSAASGQAWLRQSIVNDGSNNPVFSYPHTAMSAWLCQSVHNSDLCVGGQGGSPTEDCPNNSSPQAQIYYSKLTRDPNNLPQSTYAIYAVQNCDGSEGVDGVDATVPALGNQNGEAAIEADMMAQCKQH
ncbi:MAG TPA: hypothetical protein VMU61_00310 [Candidatus Aquilonibacter sp.]|nr:hypothetical protein [Candidatus Aquilonibacter sp.]